MLITVNQANSTLQPGFSSGPGYTSGRPRSCRGEGMVSFTVAHGGPIGGPSQRVANSKSHATLVATTGGPHNLLDKQVVKPPSQRHPKHSNLHC